MSVIVTFPPDTEQLSPIGTMLPSMQAHVWSSAHWLGISSHMYEGDASSVTAPPSVM